MAIRGAKTIAEYAIRRWMAEHNFVIENFTLTMDENIGTLQDHRGESMMLVYDPVTKMVSVKED